MAHEDRALGMIETRGLVCAIEAADAMVKAAPVSLIGKELTSGGLVLIKVAGETGLSKQRLMPVQLQRKEWGN